MKKILLSICAIFGLSAGLIAQTTFSYTGAVQTYTVPAGVTAIQIECWGAQGEDHGSSEGGLGGYVSGEMTVTPGQVLEVYVGGIDGYNGGGAAGTGGSATQNGVVGGGGSDVRISPYGLADRVIVAGGGGGAGRGDCTSQDGGDGGWPGGLGGTASGSFTSDPGTLAGGGNTVDGDCSGDCSCSPSGGGGGGGDGGGGGGSYGAYGGSGVISLGGTGGACGEDGTDGAGGAGSAGDGGCFGIGGAGGSYSNGGGGGGGGGWYGGGAGGGNWAAGGGGGSSHFDAALTATTFTNGTNTGDGQVVITDLCFGLITTVSDDTVCVGDEVTLTAASSGSGTITWDGGVVDGTPFTPPAGSTTYTATSSDPNDCAFSVTIFVGDIPTVDAGSDISFCPGDSVMVSASGTATDWSWDGGITNGVNFLPPSGTTTYTVIGTIDSTGCQATDMVDVAEVIIDITVTATGTDLMSNQAGATYQWLDCPGLTPISGETDQSYTPGADGDYAVEVTMDGCVDTSACQAVHVGIADLQNGNKPNVYPNPTTENVTIFAKGSFTYQLVSAKGDVISIGEGKDAEEVDMHNLPAGTYMINVMTEFGVQPVKVVKK